MLVDFRDDDIEGTGATVLQQLLVPGPKPARAADRLVSIGAGEQPGLGLDAGVRDAHLVRDRGVAL